MLEILQTEKFQSFFLALKTDLLFVQLHFQAAVKYIPGKPRPAALPGRRSGGARARGAERTDLEAFMAINIHLRTPFAAHKFWYAVFPFSFVSRCFLFLFFFISSLTHWLFRSMLFNLHVFVNFPVFFL
ncbi:unnamed protein product [Nyctereutes procyonoides]|uniref:(raccoon dog) hypothetical protein n=1 Tax=Nyctereutes procyonoides TaxID=34880 RepID=A0A811YF89_NYCPR|nr:unnamed protein product [Nyctereutes procyonoides]